MRKILLIIYYFAVVSSNLIVVRQSNDHLWEEFKDYFQKNYSPEEDPTKKSNWENSLRSIFDHNVHFHNGSSSFSIGLNQFGDMTDDDFQEIAAGLESKLECNNRSMVYVPPSNVTIPASIDWHKKGYVTHVQNQGACGACWAFCGVAALEGQHKRMTGKLVKLSEQHLIDCSTITGNKRCKGGQTCRAYEYAASVGGVALAKQYPLTDEDNECRFSKKHLGSKLSGYLEIPYGDEHALLIAVALMGPVAAGLDGFRPKFRHYKSGIYDDHGCSNVALNHAVTIVGYGTEHGKDFWLVKNSWGRHWGENGFGKMIRNKHNQCGLASSAILPLLSKDEEGNPVLNGPRAH